MSIEKITEAQGIQKKTASITWGIQTQTQQLIQRINQVKIKTVRKVFFLYYIECSKRWKRNKYKPWKCLLQL